MTCPSSYINQYIDVPDSFSNYLFFKNHIVNEWDFRHYLAWRSASPPLTIKALNVLLKEYKDVISAFIKKKALTNDLQHYLGQLKTKTTVKNCNDLVDMKHQGTTTNYLSQTFTNSQITTNTIGVLSRTLDGTSTGQRPQPQQQQQQQQQQAAAAQPPQQQEEPEPETSPPSPYPSSKQAEQKDDDESDDQYDTRKLLFKLAYYFEGGEQEKLDKLLDINKETMDKILGSSQTTFGEMMDAEGGKMLKNYSELKDKKDLLFLRLLLSRIVSDMSSSMTSRLKRCLGKNAFDDLISNTLKCFDLDRQELEKDTEVVMDDIIDVYHEEGIIAAKIKLCDVKKELLSSRPRSNSLIAIEALEYIISHIESWNKPGKSSEADYYARFSGLFEVVFQDVNIKMTSGETTSTSTKAIRTYNESLFGHTSKNGVFGRKIDGIICYQDLELCLCEYKPPSVSSSTLLKQQVKNLRSNSCVFHHLQELSPESDDLYIYGMDWRGTNGTMYVMKNIDNVMVATSVGKLVIPDDPMELDSIKTTISLLFSLKNHLLTLTRKYRSLQQAQKRQLEELDDEDSTGFTTPPTMRRRSVSPLVFFSPMKRH